MGDAEHAHSDGSEYDVLPIPLLFHEHAFVVHVGDAPASAATAAPIHVDASAVFEPLESFFGALRVGDALGEFLDDDMALCLAMPSLELSVYEDDVYARHVSLHDILSLHTGLGRESEFSVSVSQVPRFITRYNALAMELNDGEDVDETLYEDAEGADDYAEGDYDEAEAGRVEADAEADAEADNAEADADADNAEADADDAAAGAPDEAVADDEQAEAKADSGYDAAAETAEQEAAYGADEADARAPTALSPLHDDYYDEREEGFDVDISSDEARDVAEYEDEPGSKRAAPAPATDAKRTRTE